MEEIKIEDLLKVAAELKSQGYRLAQACAYNEGDKPVIIYSFDLKINTMKNIKVTVNENYEVESLTGLFFSAFIYENEMHDLFGIKFKNSQLDFGGKFFKVSKETPWKSDNISIVEEKK